MDIQAKQLIASFECDDRGFRFFSDYADAAAPAEVAERALELMLERK